MLNELKGDFKAILDQMPQGVLVIDQQLNPLYGNPAFLHTFHIEALAQLSALILKSKFADSLHFESFILNCIQNGIKRNANFQLSSGRYINVEYYCISQSKEEPLHGLNFWEMGRQEELYAELYEQKKFYERILNNIPADIAIFNPHHTYIFLNENAIKDPALRSWMIGKTDFDYCKLKNLSTGLAEYRRSKFNEMCKTRKAAMWEDIAIRPDGEEVFVLRILHPYYNAKGELEVVVGYGVDVSELKKKDWTLSERERKSQELINQLKDVVISMDTEGQIQSLNPAWHLLTGFTTTDSLQQNITHFIADSDRHPAVVLSRIKYLL